MDQRDKQDQRAIWKEKRQILQEEQAKFKDAFQFMAKHWAGIASAAIVILSYIQYSYKYGVCKVFNLPVTAVTIKLSDYIPLAVLLCFFTLYFIDCFAELNPLHPRERVYFHFSIYRILCGTAFNYIALNLLFNDEDRNQLLLIVVSVVPPLIMEYFLKKRILKIASINLKKSYKQHLINDTDNRMLYKMFLKPFLILILVILMLIPVVSEFVTRHRDVYEVCTFADKTYAVIFNITSDYVLMQPAEVKGDSITIHTASYNYCMKKDTDKITFRHFDHVTITDDAIADSKKAEGK